MSQDQLNQPVKNKHSVFIAYNIWYDSAKNKNICSHFRIQFELKNLKMIHSEKWIIEGEKHSTSLKTTLWRDCKKKKRGWISIPHITYTKDQNKGNRQKNSNKRGNLFSLIIRVKDLRGMIRYFSSTPALCRNERSSCDGRM